MTWRNLVVGVMYADTYALPDNDRTTLITEGVIALRDFRNATAAAHVGPASLWDQINGRPSMVFVAPEYMLAKSGNPPTDDRLRTLAEKNTIETEMAQLSAQYGESLVLVPGSIAYVEPLVLNPVKRLEIERRLEMGVKATGTVLQRMAAEHTELAKVAVTVADIIREMNTAHRLSTMPAQQVSLPGPTTPSTREKREAINRGDVRFLAKNEMVMFHKGKAVARYAKIADFNEVPPSRQGAGANCTIFVPGAKIGRAAVGGVPWGIEICFDHNLGVLSNTPADTLPRVHLLCSASVARTEQHSVVQNGGYVVHASSDVGECGVWRRDPQTQTYVAVAKQDTVPVQGGSAWMLMYEIELDLP